MVRDLAFRETEKTEFLKMDLGKGEEVPMVDGVRSLRIEVSKTILEMKETEFLTTGLMLATELLTGLGRGSTASLSRGSGLASMSRGSGMEDLDRDSAHVSLRKDSVLRTIQKFK